MDGMTSADNNPSFDLENLDFWLKQPPPDFLLAIVNELRECVINIQGYTQIVRGNAEIKNITLVDENPSKTLPDVCDIILDNSHQASRLLNLVLEYAQRSKY